MGRWRFRIALFLLTFFAMEGIDPVANAVPLSAIGTFCGTFPAQCQKGTMSLLAAKGTTDNIEYVLEVDPVTGAIPVTATVSIPSVGPTGAAVPLQADYLGLNFGGTLIGAVGDASGRQIIVGAGTAGTPAGGVVSVQGVAGGTAVPVSISGTTPISGTVTVSNLATNQDQNYGSPGASTLRTAAMLGIGSTAVAVGNPVFTEGSNGTSAVAFASGADGATVPRVTLSTRAETVSTPLAAQLSNGTTAIAYGSGITGTAVPRVVQAGYDSTLTVVASNSYAATNVTTAAYVQLIASTANAVNTICLSDSSGSIMKVATGAAASEVDRIYLPGGGAGCYAVNIPAATRISLKAIDATASTGYFLYTGY